MVCPSREHDLPELEEHTNACPGIGLAQLGVAPLMDAYRYQPYREPGFVGNVIELPATRSFAQPPPVEYQPEGQVSVVLTRG